MNQPAPITLDRKAVIRLLGEDSTLATVLYAICLTAYGEEVFTLDPIEIFTRLEEDFGPVTEDNENKINASITLLTTDAFYHDPDAFKAICNTFAEGDPGLDVMDEVTAPEILWGVYEAELQRDQQSFSPAIEQLIHQTMASEWSDDESQDGSFYVFEYLKEARENLAKQLREAGFNPTLPPLINPTAAGLK